MPERAKYMDLYKYSSPKEKCVVVLGLTFSVLGDAALPTHSIILGRVVKMFDPDISPEAAREILLDFLWFIIFAMVAIFIFIYLGYALMQISAERVSFRLRAKYLSGLLKQEVEFFERQQIEALPSKMSEYFTHISEGSGERTG